MTITNTDQSELENGIQFIGHSTVLIALDGRNFFTDINFSKKILKFSKRKNKLGIDLNNVPSASALLVSHAHHDHLDLFSYKYFDQTTPIITPPQINNFIKRFFNHPTLSLKHWKEFHTLPITITAVPTKHRGGRLSGLRYTQSNGYILKSPNYCVYFSGDTGYGDHFKKIGEKFDIDVALLPIDSFRPHWFFKNVHMGVEKAIEAFKDLKAKKMVPVHYGSFHLGWNKGDEPLKELKKIIKDENLEDKICLLKPGEILDLS